jgi:tryptophan synthase beta chain
MAKTEGILPAIETSHAIAYVMKAAVQRSKDDVIVVCLSGRGDKDVNEVARLTGQEM